MNEKQERMWATFCHLGTFSSAIIPFGNILAPLLIYLFKKEESHFVKDNAKESLNFQISIIIYELILFCLCTILFIILDLLNLILIVFFIFTISLAIFAVNNILRAVRKAHNGEQYHYPLTIRFIK